MLRSHYAHLTEGQAWEALQVCERNYTAEAGLTWDDVADLISELFPEPDSAGTPESIGGNKSE